MKALQWVIIGVLVAVIAWLWFRPEEVSPVIQGHIDSTQVIRKQIDSLLLRQQELRLDKERDSLKQVASKRLYEAKIRKLENTALQARREVQILIDTIPALTDFVQAQDSVIAAQGQFIDTLQEQAGRQAQTYQALLNASEEKYRLSEEINRHLNEVTAEYQKRERKFKKQSTGLKVATAGAFILGVLVGK